MRFRLISSTNTPAQEPPRKKLVAASNTLRPRWRREADQDVNQIARVFACSTAYLTARAVRAMKVSDGLTHDVEDMQDPSVTKRWVTSCAWLCSFSTDSRGSLPMRAPPNS